jgi:hypothetical protein
MTASRLHVAVVVVVGAALAVAGCGDSSTDAYKKQVTQAAQQFQADARTAGTSLSASQSPEQFQAAASRFKAAVTKFTDKLDSLKPPDRAKDEQDQLVTDLKRFSGTVNRVSHEVANVGARNVERLVALVPQLQRDVQRVSTDAQELQDAVNNG